MLQSSDNIKTNYLFKLIMLAKFQGVLFKVEKHEELPVYFLHKGKKYIGTLSLDTNRFHMCVEIGETIGTGEVISFIVDPKDFQLLDYDIVSSEWLNEIMELKNLSVKDVSEFLGGTAESTIYKWVSGKNEIPGSAKASLFSLLNK